MSNKFEDQLRAALQPVDPPEGFADRVMQRLDLSAHSSPKRPAWRWPTALAASVVTALVVSFAWRADHERRGLAARQQLMEALRVTGEKLDLAYRGVNVQPEKPPGSDTGA